MVISSAAPPVQSATSPAARPLGWPHVHLAPRPRRRHHAALDRTGASEVTRAVPVRQRRGALFSIPWPRRSEIW